MAEKSSPSCLRKAAPATSKALDFVKGHFIKMGWHSSLPTNPEDRKIFLTSFFKALTEDNPYHPVDVPYNRTIPAFFKQIQSALIENVYPNEASHLKAFKSWVHYANFDKSKTAKSEEPKRLPTQADIKATYQAETSKSLIEQANHIANLIDMSPTLAELPQFYEHRRALVNELILRGLQYPSILNK